MAYTLVDLASEILQKADIPLSAEEIWNQAQEQGLTEKFKSKNPKKTLGITLARNLEDKETTPFVIVDYRPKRFWLKAREGELDSEEMQKKIYQREEKEEQEGDDENESRGGFNERKLHPLAVRFLHDNFGLYCETIFHESSKRAKSGRNQWIHPDIVGVHYPQKIQNQATVELLKNFGKIPYKLYSFELKIRLNLSNLKNYYFQAVSNSSWANEGYLVFLHWSEEEEIREELERLNQAFGIGVIQLDCEDINNARIIFPAKDREVLDFQTIDLLAEENKGFENFIKNINHNIRLKNSIYSFQIDKSKYDPILDDREIEEHIKKYNII